MNILNRKPKVIIRSGYRWSYFQWFLLGFYELEKQKKIDLKFTLPFASQTLTKISNNLLIKVFDKLRRMCEKDDYNLCGEIIFEDGKRKKFVIDSADAPFLFSGKDLEICDCYFKMQYPIDLDKGLDHFSLTNDVKIPWCDHAHEDDSLTLTQRGKRKSIILSEEQKKKIFPLMIGTRQLARSTSYQSLKKGYDNYLKDRKINKSKSLMCYFGNAKGPKPEIDTTKSNIDYDWEADIMGFYEDKLQHPNVKRGKVADYISANIKDSDARVIDRGFSDQKVALGDQVIPLREFCKHVAKFEYNCNVSGYRLSIPNRFIESFMVGTAIVTDKLHIRWYKSFDEEVIETVEMGYYKDSQVDWDTFEKILKELPHSNVNQVIKSFEKKWKPEIVAQYIIDTLKNI